MKKPCPCALPKSNWEQGIKKPEFQDVSQAAQYVPVLLVEIVFPDLLNWYKTLISSQKDILFAYFDSAETQKSNSLCSPKRYSESVTWKQRSQMTFRKTSK